MPPLEGPDRVLSPLRGGRVSYVGSDGGRRLRAASSGRSTPLSCVLGAGMPSAFWRGAGYALPGRGPPGLDTSCGFTGMRRRRVKQSATSRFHHRSNGGIISPRQSVRKAIARSHPVLSPVTRPATPFRRWHSIGSACPSRRGRLLPGFEGV